MTNLSRLIPALIAAALVLLVFGPTAMSGGLPLQAPSHKALSITASVLIVGGLILEGWKAGRERWHLHSPRALDAIMFVCLTAAACKVGAITIELSLSPHIS